MIYYELKAVPTILRITISGCYMKQCIMQDQLRLFQNCCYEDNLWWQKQCKCSHWNEGYRNTQKTTDAFTCGCSLYFAISMYRAINPLGDKGVECRRGTRGIGAYRCVHYKFGLFGRLTAWIIYIFPQSLKLMCETSLAVVPLFPDVCQCHVPEPEFPGLWPSTSVLDPTLQATAAVG